MNTKSKLMLGLATVAALAAGLVHAVRPQPSLAGDYLEVRSCDIYRSVYTELAAFKGSELNLTWEMTGKRSAYVATFAR